MLDELSIKSGCFHLMDRGYVAYEKLYDIDQSKAFFVTRVKTNISYKAVKKEVVDKVEKPMRLAPLPRFVFSP